MEFPLGSGVADSTGMPALRKISKLPGGGLIGQKVDAVSPNDTLAFSVSVEAAKTFLTPTQAIAWVHSAAKAPPVPPSGRMVVRNLEVGFIDAAYRRIKLERTTGKTDLNVQASPGLESAASASAVDGMAEYSVPIRVRGI
jgi:hypothetical protein